LRALIGTNFFLNSTNQGDFRRQRNLFTILQITIYYLFTNLLILLFMAIKVIAQRRVLKNRPLGVFLVIFAF
jgi:hypothetical protein